MIYLLGSLSSPPISQTSQVVRQRRSTVPELDSFVAAALRVGPDISFEIGTLGHLNIWTFVFIFMFIRFCYRPSVLRLLRVE